MADQSPAAYTSKLRSFFLHPPRTVGLHKQPSCSGLTNSPTYAWTVSHITSQRNNFLVHLLPKKPVMLDSVGSKSFSLLSLTPFPIIHTHFNKNVCRYSLHFSRILGIALINRKARHGTGVSEPVKRDALRAVSRGSTNVEDCGHFPKCRLKPDPI